LNNLIGLTVVDMRRLIQPRGALVDPDPARFNISGSDLDPDPAGSEAGSGKYWPDLHNYDIKHHSIFCIPGNYA